MRSRDSLRSTLASVGIHALLLILMMFWTLPSAPHDPTLMVELLLDMGPLPEPAPPLSVESRPPSSLARTSAPSSRVHTASPNPTSSRSVPTSSSRSVPTSSSRSVPTSTSRPQSSMLPSGSSAPSSGTRTGTPPPRPRSGAGADFSPDLHGDPLPPPRSGSGSTSDATSPSRDSRTPGEGEIREGNLKGGSVLGQGASSGSGTASTGMIDWGGGFARQRIAGVLPKYPPTAQGDVTVRVRLTVLPDGTVRDLTLVTKGQPVCDQTALLAVRTWRFAALPQDRAQSSQQAVVTFHFTAR